MHTAQRTVLSKKDNTLTTLPPALAVFQGPSADLQGANTGEHAGRLQQLNGLLQIIRAMVVLSVLSALPPPILLPQLELQLEMGVKFNFAFRKGWSCP